MRYPLLTLFLSILVVTGKAQQSKYTAFTVSDGLPSNYVYRSIEDDKGFLWVATDAGIARFDGKHFQVFTTKDGLPDNEVLSVIKEKNGRIWVNCFKQSPAYFDEIKNRFINASVLSKIKETTGNMVCFPLKNGGVMFHCEKGSYIFKSNKLTTYLESKGHGFFITENADGSYLELQVKAIGSTKILVSKIYLRNGSNYEDSVAINTRLLGGDVTYGINDGKLYYFNNAKGKFYIYSNFTTKPLKFKVDSIIAPEPFNNSEFTNEHFYLLGVSGKGYFINKKSLQVNNIVSGNYIINSLYKDHKGNMWVGTVDKGLIVYKANRFNNIDLPHGFIGTNFLSIARKNDGTLLAGNFYGQVVEKRQSKIIIHSISKQALIARQRKIIVSKNQVFTFSEQGIYSNYNNALGTFGKTAIVYNDSIVLVGQSYGLVKLNIATHTLTPLNVQRKRVTSLAVCADGLIYFGSTDGLYKYDYIKNTVVPFAKNNPLLSERITALCVTGDGLVWVATSGSGIVVLKNDKIVHHFTESNGIINNASRSITAGKSGQIWLGTSEGISVIDYKLNGGNWHYDIKNLTEGDGLTNNVVNEMLYQKDTIYAATGNGISIIPANFFIPKFNIPVQLIHMIVNQRDTIITSLYKLSYTQKNIQMQFAGIELNGHFKNLQYTLDKNKNWTNLDANILTIQLSSGYHTVQVRAVDVNGNISNKILTLNFDITTPFWKAIWFWVTLAIITQIFIIYMINARQKRRKEAKLANQIAGVQTAALEQQAFTSLMNPHFMFNALNSIQHYMNMQDRQNTNRYLSDFASLIRKNFEAAQQSFIPLEQEIENIKIYLRLEQMRFNDRFSNQMVIDEHLETDDWMVPTMILQPLIENALLHGIMPSAIAGEIVIDLKEREGNLVIIITDNGIGIANSTALKVGTHKSRGMELIKKRITALSRFGTQAITISMLPAFADEKNPGNQIILFIPRELHQAWIKAQR
jgi:ligand-binding sensor domain-containing protein/two-component sensor histidine kinase